MTTRPPLHWQTLGIEVKWRRKELGLSQAELAQSVGIVPNSVSRLENGHPSSIETVQSIATALDWSFLEATRILAGIPEPELEEPAAAADTSPPPDVRDLPGVDGFYIAPPNPERVTSTLVGVNLAIDERKGGFLTEDDLKLVGNLIVQVGNRLFQDLAARNAEDQPPLDAFFSAAKGRS